MLPEIFKKFGQSARQVLLSAQKIAEGMNETVNSEHILLGITIVPKTLAFDVLKEYLVSPDQLRLVMGLRGAKPQNTKSKITAEAKIILKKAVQTAVKFHHCSVEAEHLLFAILSDKSNAAYQLIAQTGIDPEIVRRQIEYIFADIAEADRAIENKSQKNEGPKTYKYRSRNGQDEFIVEEVDPREYRDYIDNIEHDAMLGSKIAPKTKNKSSTPALDCFTTDLVEKARQGKIDPVVGREQEISRAIQILCRRTKNNPVFIGEPGVGKTALVEGLARKIAYGEVPEILKNKRLVSLDLSLMVAGTVYRGQFEERIKKLIEELASDQNIIVFVDELHTVVGAGAAEGAIDAANILKPTLAKGEIRLIGATTEEEYRKHIEKDAALERRLQPILVTEPTPEEAIKMLTGLKDYYEKFHNVSITQSAIEAAVKLSARYISDRFLPDKAIDLLDETAAAVKIASAPQDLDEIQKIKTQIENIKSQKEAEIERENFELAAKLRDHEKMLIEKLEKIKKEKLPGSKKIQIIASDIAKTVSVWTKIPVGELIREEKLRFLNLEGELGKQIIAQDEAVRELSRSLRRNRSGIGDISRPIGSFIFLGPTGVGKTELAKVLARQVYGREDALIKIDMSEFMERHNISRLVGAPPGYIGYEEAGKLTEAVRRHPYSAILFDEIEKAHPEFFNILLQILEDGYLTDARGRKVNFRNTIIIMTSNLGSKEFNSRAKIGFNTQKEKADFEEIKNTVLEKVKEHFLPEFLNRIDKIIVFNPLNRQALEKICLLQLEVLSQRIEEQKKIILRASPKTAAFIVDKYYQPEYGARPLRRAIDEEITGPLSELVLARQLKGKIVKIKPSGQKIKFYVK